MVSCCVASLFFVGYTITNLAGGYLATKYTSKFVLTVGILVWSTFTMLTPAASAASLVLLLACRFLMGMGEGVTFPAIQHLVVNWVRQDARSRANCFIFSGGKGQSHDGIHGVPAVPLWHLACG